MSIIERFKRNPCKECDYYCATNNTCQRKKCTTYNPYVSKLDRMFCKPYEVIKPILGEKKDETYKC